MKIFDIKKKIIGVYGIGNQKVNLCLSALNFPLNYKKSSEKELQTVENFILDTLGDQIENNLKRNIKNDIKHKISIKSYKGFRHLYSLSVRGQNTKNNCKTRKRRKKAVKKTNKK